MAYIRVVYKTKDRDFDYVPTDLLGTMITRDEITLFFGLQKRNGLVSNLIR